MELHMQSHHWERRMPDWLAAAVAGVIGGALVIVLEFFWSTMVLNESPWRPTHKIAAMVMGPSALEQMSLFSLGIVATALVLHFVLGAVMGMILGAVIAPFHFDSSVGMEAAIGVAFGIVAYVVNFYGMTVVFRGSPRSAAPGHCWRTCCSAWRPPSRTACWNGAHRKRCADAPVFSRGAAYRAAPRKTAAAGLRCRRRPFGIAPQHAARISSRSARGRPSPGAALHDANQRTSLAIACGAQRGGTWRLRLH